jgi:hypothetical protein
MRKKWCPLARPLANRDKPAQANEHGARGELSAPTFAPGKRAR